MKIKTKEREAIIQSLRAGVVPKLGIQHIQVGRHKEIESLLKDIENIADGGSGIRFVIGEYGSGKTFFLNLVKSIALEKKLIVSLADLTPNRKLYATNGQGRALYSEIIKNLSTRSKPHGNALQNIIERFISNILAEASESSISPNTLIHKKLSEFNDFSGGYDFAEVISLYWKGYDNDNEQLMQDALKWIRAEYSTKTDAKQAIGVRTIIDDNNYMDILKLLAKLAVLSGFQGLLVGFDELVNLYKISNSKARNSNYEYILSILNDSLQGISTNIGYLMSGTPELLYDTHRGLYSYDALKTRLSDNVFTKEGINDYDNIVIKLQNLSNEDIFILLKKIRTVFSNDDEKELIDDDGIIAYMKFCNNKIGASYFQTPRNTIKAFVDLLSVLSQNPDKKWDDFIEQIEIEPDINDDDLEEIEI